MSLRLFSRTPCIVALVYCLTPAHAVRAAEPEPPDVVYLVGGIGGISPLVPAARLAFPLAGVHDELRDFPWQHGKARYLRDLQDAGDLRKKAEELAKAIRELHEREPKRRIYLIGHSAGTAIVVQAAEILPPASLERIILLSSALSPTYDLTAALRATRGEIVSFYSQLDRLLDWGTTRFGTADRVYGPAAGLNGFQKPATLDDEGKRCYERLVQVPWTIDRALELQGGLHHDTTMPIFLAKQVAPWLKSAAPGAGKKPE